VTDLAALARADLNACFDLFERTAERLEVLPAYAVGGAEEDRLRAFRLGLPRPERSVRTSPWLARIARPTATGKSWRRIRVLGWPLTEYQRYQLAGYQESAAAPGDRGPAGEPPMTIRVVVADDQGMVRSGFSILLNAQPDIEVIGEAVNGQEAIARAAELRPDVILMDVRMPVLHGLQATRQITAADGAPKVLVLTTFDLDDYVYEALRSGASGFLLKDASAGELAEAVRVVAAGDALLAPGVTRRLIAEFARLGAPRAASRKNLPDLTERETEVLALVARGLSNAEIAAHRVVAEQTVKTHVSRVLMKLALRDRAQAVVFAYENGLVRPGE